MEKIYIGKVKNSINSVGGEHIYLTKHSWDCDWYWGFGYVGNKNFHTHFDITFLNIDKYTPYLITVYSQKKSGGYYVTCSCKHMHSRNVLMFMHMEDIKHQQKV